VEYFIMWEEVVVGKLSEALVANGIDGGK